MATAGAGGAAAGPATGGARAFDLSDAEKRSVLHQLAIVNQLWPGNWDVEPHRAGRPANAPPGLTVREILMLGHLEGLLHRTPRQRAEMVRLRAELDDDGRARLQAAKDGPLRLKDDERLDALSGQSSLSLSRAESDEYWNLMYRNAYFHSDDPYNGLETAPLLRPRPIASNTGVIPNRFIQVDPEKNLTLDEARIEARKLALARFKNSPMALPHNTRKISYEAGVQEYRRLLREARLELAAQLQEDIASAAPRRTRRLQAQYDQVLEALAVEDQDEAAEALNVVKGVRAELTRALERQATVEALAVTKKKKKKKKKKPPPRDDTPVDDIIDDDYDDVAPARQFPQDMDGPMPPGNWEFIPDDFQALTMAQARRVLALEKLERSGKLNARTQAELAAFRLEMARNLDMMEFTEASFKAARAGPFTTVAAYQRYLALFDKEAAGSLTANEDAEFLVLALRHLYYHNAAPFPSHDNDYYPPHPLPGAKIDEEEEEEEMDLLPGLVDGPFHRGNWAIQPEGYTGGLTIRQAQRLVKLEKEEAALGKFSVFTGREELDDLRDQLDQEDAYLDTVAALRAAIAGPMTTATEVRRFRQIENGGLAVADMTDRQAMEWRVFLYRYNFYHNDNPFPQPPFEETRGILHPPVPLPGEEGDDDDDDEEEAEVEEFPGRIPLNHIVNMMMASIINWANVQPRYYALESDLMWGFDREPDQPGRVMRPQDRDLWHQAAQNALDAHNDGELTTRNLSVPRRFRVDRNIPGITHQWQTRAGAGGLARARMLLPANGINPSAFDWNFDFRTLQPNQVPVQQPIGQAFNPNYPLMIPGRIITAVNMYEADFWPQYIDAWYLRRHNGVDAGTRVIDARTGRPFVLWEYFSTVLARLAMTMLERAGFPQGSFWQISLMRLDPVTGSETPLSSRLSMEPPTQESVLEAINGLNDGVTSNGEGNDDNLHRVDSNTFMRVHMYNPSTGHGGSMPDHLLSKTKSAWSPGGLHCAAKSMVVCLATQMQRKNLKLLDGCSGAMMNKIAPLLDQVGSGAWGYAEIHKASNILGCHTTVLDAVTYVRLFDTADQDKLDMSTPIQDPDEDEQWLLDNCFEVEEEEEEETDTQDKPRIFLLKWVDHFIACTSVNGIEKNRSVHI